MAGIDLKKHFSFVFVSLFIGLLVVGCLLFFAQKFSRTHRLPLPIAIVNLQRLYDQADAFKDFRNEIEKRHEKAYQDVRTQENKLRKEYQSLIKSKNKDTKTMQQRKAKFEKNKGALEKKVQKERASLNQNFKEIDSKLKKKVLEVVNTLAVDYQVKLIVNTQVGEHDLVIFAESSLNLTDELIRRVNKQIYLEDIKNEKT